MITVSTLRAALGLRGRRAVWAAAGGLCAGMVCVALAVSGEPQAAPLPAETFSIDATATTVAAGEPGAAATSGAAAPATGAPLRLALPEIGIDAAIEPTNLRGGDLVIPGDPHVVGLWSGGASLDSEEGITLLAGHVDINGNLGALHPLADVSPGAQVTTTDDDGELTTWTVTGLEVRRKDDLPPFSPTGPRRLVLVTCGGPVDHVGGRWTYRDNVIVTAVPTGR